MNIPGLDFSSEELSAAVDEGRVTRRAHESLPYFIYNYSPEVAFTNYWEKVTLQCRGLILDENDHIVSRPWKKFFNIGQVELPADFVDGPLEVMDKLDGSLGILYYAGPGDYRVATRGSFHSEQAEHATDLWRRRYSHFEPSADLTYLFEIVYPSNRIVLDYQGMDDLVLLGAVQKSTGYYVGPVEAAARLYSADWESTWTGPAAKVFEHKNLSDVLGDTARPNAEGFVIRKHNFLVKVKQNDYLELHRLVTNCSPRKVWEQLRDGKTVVDIVSAFPDEFHEWVRGMAEPLVGQYRARAEEITAKYSAYHYAHIQMDDGSRKRFAERVKNDSDKRYMFLLLDSKPIGSVLWDELRPAAVELNDGTE